MDYKETHISFLHDDLLKEYGNQQGERLYAFMRQKFADLCKEEVKSENHEINKHVFEKLLPTISKKLIEETVFLIYNIKKEDFSLSPLRGDLCFKRRTI